MPKFVSEQTLDDFQIGDKVAYTYFSTAWNFDTIIGTVTGFTKHQVRVKFDRNRFSIERKTLRPTALTRKSDA